MSDYSNVLQVLGAMVLVALLINNANRTSFLNKQIAIEGEYETELTAIAQDIMEESRSLPFDEVTIGGYVPVNIPDDFSSTTGLDADDTNDRSEFDDFDDYDGWSSTINTVHGDFDVSVTVGYVSPTTFNDTTANTSMKEMSITITNTILRYQDNNMKVYNFSYVRSYYAD